MNIELKRISADSKLNEIIDFSDADYETINDVINGDDDEVFGISCDDTLVGIAPLFHGKNAYLYIFIDPAFRGRGIGTAALSLCEAELFNNGAMSILTTYNINTARSDFAKKHGYERRYASDFMVYDGVPYDLTDVPVRVYDDTDYYAAHKLYAEAFHAMRTAVGDFPNSVVEQPSEKMRAQWKESAAERLVYEYDGQVVAYAHVCGDVIASVAVDIAHWHKGIGGRFVQHIVNAQRASGYNKSLLYCVVGNTARNLYEKLGFRTVSTSEYAIKRAQ